MSDYLPALQLELMTLAASVCPKLILPGNGTYSNFHTSVQAARLAVIEMSKNPATPPPYYGFVIGKFNADPDFGGLDNDFQRAPIAFFKIDANTTQAAINADLYNFKVRIDQGTGFSTFQPMERGNIDSSEVNPFNEALLKDAHGNLLGGHVFWNPGFLVGYRNGS